MKIITGSFAILTLIIALSGCSGKSSAKKESKSVNDTVSVPDTGFTGISQYKSGQFLIKEITFKNGVRQGLMKSFYKGGQVYQTFWYENGLREDSVKWYYLEGQLFRSTPYKHDTIDGIQKQYYRSGKLKARIGYSKGMRTSHFEEFSQEGKLVGNYPEINVSILDEYKTTGKYRINLELSDKNSKVVFYRGEFTDGRFDTTKCQLIKTLEGKGTITLNKTTSKRPSQIGVIAEILTPYGNKLLRSKKIDLPYSDLK
jgi:antitoxin component YwqK of YwqJK toxin-antitoxin module